MSGAALVGYWTIYHTRQPLLGLAAFMSAAALLGVLHAPIALFLGAEAMLLVSVIVHMLWIEGWLALPSFTGGSGGLFWPNSAWVTAIVTLSGTALIAGAIEAIEASSASTYRAAVIIHTGNKSAVFGINRPRSIVLAYLVFGVVVGGVSCSIINWIGYLSFETTGTSFATAILLIALGTARRSVSEVLVVCGCQAALRTFVRAAFAISPLTAHCLDLVLPLLLFFLIKQGTLNPQVRSTPHE